MIFKPPIARKILRGEKTQARYPVVADTDCRYRPGRTYAVQPGHRPAIGRLLVLDVHQEPLGDLSYQDARSEGFRTRDDFFEHWANVRGRVKPEQPVWVVSFKLDSAETVRLLHKFSERGYTTDRHEAMPSENEAVDDATLNRFAKDNAARFEPVRLERARARKEQRQTIVEQLRAEARAAGVDANSKLRRLRLALEEFDAVVYDEVA